MLCAVVVSADTLSDTREIETSDVRFTHSVQGPTPGTTVGGAPVVVVVAAVGVVTALRIIHTEIAPIPN